jgi:L-arabinonolactonase
VFPRYFRILEEKYRLAGTAFLAGPRFTLADVTCYVWLECWGNILLPHEKQMHYWAQFPLVAALVGKIDRDPKMQAYKTKWVKFSQAQSFPKPPVDMAPADGLVEHIVLFQLKAGLTAEEWLNAVLHINQMKREIPDVIDVSCGAISKDSSPHGYTHGLTTRFPNKAAGDAYQIHPFHVHVRDEILKPLAAGGIKPMAVDWIFPSSCQPDPATAYFGPLNKQVFQQAASACPALLCTPFAQHIHLYTFAPNVDAQINEWAYGIFSRMSPEFPEVMDVSAGENFLLARGRGVTHGFTARLSSQVRNYWYQTSSTEWQNTVAALSRPNFNLEPENASAESSQVQVEWTNVPVAFATAVQACGVNKLGECPLWDVESQSLCWIDIADEKLYTMKQGLSIACEAMVEVFDLDETPGCFGFVDEEPGSLVFGFRDGFYKTNRQGRDMVLLGDKIDADIPATRLNDGRVDRQGRLVCGGFNEGKEPLSGVHQLVEGKPRLLLDLKVRCWNSCCFSVDGKTMYCTDSPKKVLMKYDYDTATGEARNPRELCSVVSLGIPCPPDLFTPTISLFDGAIVDSEDHIWAAVWPSTVVRITPDGALHSVVRVPALTPTCPCLGGPDLRTLYVTSLDLDVYDKDKNPHGGRAYTSFLPSFHYAPSPPPSPAFLPSFRYI